MKKKLKNDLVRAQNNDLYTMIVNVSGIIVTSTFKMHCCYDIFIRM